VLALLLLLDMPLIHFDPEAAALLLFLLLPRPPLPPLDASEPPVPTGLLLPPVLSPLPPTPDKPLKLSLLRDRRSTLAAPRGVQPLPPLPRREVDADANRRGSGAGAPPAPDLNRLLLEERLLPSASIRTDRLCFAFIPPVFPPPLRGELVGVPLDLTTPGRWDTATCPARDSLTPLAATGGRVLPASVCASTSAVTAAAWSGEVTTTGRGVSKDTSLLTPGTPGGSGCTAVG
jgi:hypothetical protein